MYPSLYSLVERQNLPVSRVCIENPGLFFYSQDRAPKFVINKWWIHLLFPQKCRGRGREPYPPFLFGRCLCATVSVYEPARCVEHHRLEVLVGSCKRSSYAVFPSLQAYHFLILRLLPTIPLAVGGEQHHKENTGDVIKSCSRGDYRSVILERIH